MLTPEQLQNLPQELTDLYDQLSEFILRDIARRIAKGAQITDTAEYQLYRARSLGLSTDEIAAKIAEINGSSAAEINRLIREAAAQSDEFDRKMLGADKGAAVPLEENAQLQKLISAQIAETAGKCENLTNTMGFADHDFLGRVYYLSMTDMYRREMDSAHMKVVTGATDYMTAIRQACNKLAASGVRTIDYESGRSDRIEVAARRAILTSVAHVTHRISEQNGEELGADGWEMSAHSGSRPSHAVYQGRQYTQEQYERIIKPLISEPNCRHDVFPIILGVSEPTYTEEELQNIDQPPFTYEGRTYTAYEASQQMRKMERAMRKQKDRCIVADAAGDEEAFATASIRLNRQKYIYEDFCKAADSYTEYERTYVTGFNRSIAARSGVAAIKKEYKLIASTLDKSAVPSIDDFKKMLYNSDEYKQLRHQFNEKVINSDYDDIKHLNGSLSDKVTRQWYVLHDKKIPDMIDRNQSIEDQARQAHALRNQFRTNARDLMLNQDERKWLDKSHPNLTFEEQVDKKMSDKGMTRDEAIQDILKTASKSNKKVNEKFKL
ncbi:MAG: phage minor capsid protein [Eggerthellaceae bacterium]|jgi:phage minor capsid protein 2